MGTRADFYIGTGKDAEWLGSIAWDGYEIDETSDDDSPSLAHAVKSAKTESEYRSALTAYLSARDDSTVPEQGWPWPWNDSGTTDYVYTFVGGKVSAFPWGEDYEWPDMSTLKNTTFGKRSGVMVFGGAK